MELQQQINDLIAANPTHRDSIKTTALMVLTHLEAVIKDYADRAEKRRAARAAKRRGAGSASSTQE